jgi:hypothetical protein
LAYIENLASGQPESYQTPTSQGYSLPASMRLARTEAKKYLQALDVENPVFTFHAIDDEQDKKKSRNLLWSKRGTLDAVWSHIEQANRDGFGIFVTVQETAGARRKAEDVTRFRAIFHEDDTGVGLKDIASGASPKVPAPTIFVESSPGKAHRLWVLAAPATAQQFAEAMAGMVQLGSDPKAALSTQLLRLPGTYHLKDRARPHFVTCTVDNDSSPLWGAAPTIEALLASLPATPKITPRASKSKVAAPAPVTAFDSREALAAARIGGLSVDSETVADFQSELAANALADERPPDASRVISALCSVDGVDREDWLRRGMILHAATGGGEAGAAVFFEWSYLRAPDKCEAKDQDRVWRSFTSDKKKALRLGSLFQDAKAQGWVDPAPRTNFNPLELTTETDTTPVGGGGWDEPDMAVVGDVRQTAPRLPVEVFGEDVARWIAAQSLSKSSPPDYIAACLLAFVSALVSTRTVSAHDGWEEPSPLWFALVGPPSSKKSPGMDAVTEPLKLLEAKWASENAPLLRQYETSREMARAKEARWKKLVAEAARRDLPPPLKPEAADIPKAPTGRRLVVKDVTSERLAEMLAEQRPRGMVQHRDELAGLLSGMNQYKSGGGSDRQFYLEAYGGRRYDADRMSRTAHVERLALSVVGSIQEDVLNKGLLRTAEDGLSSRFVIVLPDPTPRVSLADIVRRQAHSTELDMAGVYARLDALQPALDGRPMRLSLTPEAFAHFDRWYVGEARRGTEAAPTQSVANAFGKHEGLALRIALSLEHLAWAARCSKRDEPAPQTVGEDAIAGAIVLIDAYVRPMIVRAHGAAAATPAKFAARKIAERILADKPNEIALAKIAHGYGKAFEEHLNSAAAELEDAGWLRKFGPTGGRPSRKYNVNPRLFQ